MGCTDVHPSCVVWLTGPVGDRRKEYAKALPELQRGLLREGREIDLLRRNSIEDDHLPFLEAGVRALDLIDFNYGPDNAYWHSPRDTMDKLDAHSFEVTGNVLMRVIPVLEAEK